MKRAGTGVTMAEPVATSEDVIPLTDVMARWAYTEAVGAHSSTCYDGCAGIEALRAKRRAGVPFSELSTPERSFCLRLGIVFAAPSLVDTSVGCAAIALHTGPGKALSRFACRPVLILNTQTILGWRSSSQLRRVTRVIRAMLTMSRGAGRATIRSRWAFTMATTSLVMACTGGRRSWLPVFPPASLSTCRSRY